MSFYNGFLNFTNWSGNVILPTLAGLFFALGILRFSKGQSYSHALYSGLMCLMASGLLRALETFASQRAWNDPDVYWASIVSFVDWIGNVLMPIYAAIEVAAGGLALATGERIHFAGSGMRHFLAAGLCLMVSGLVRLAEYFVQQGTGESLSTAAFKYDDVLFLLYRPFNVTLSLGGGFLDAEAKPLCYRAERAGAERTGIKSAQVYVTVSRCYPSQDCSPRRSGVIE